MVDAGTLGFIVAALFCAGFALVAYGARVLDAGGSLLAFVLALVILQTVGIVWLGLLIGFVVVGFVITKLFWDRKRRIGVTEGKSGIRGWRNVLANGGVPAILAAMTLLNISETELAIGFVAAIATASADTFASELGVLSNRTYLITKPWLRVEPGTNGGVSVWGQFVALLGSVVATVAGVYLLGIDWDQAWWAIGAGWIGCQIDSVLGALFEEGRGRAYGFLTKSDVNFLSIALAGFGVLMASSI